MLELRWTLLPKPRYLQCRCVFVPVSCSNLRDTQAQHSHGSIPKIFQIMFFLQTLWGEIQPLSRQAVPQREGLKAWKPQCPQFPSHTWPCQNIIDINPAPPNPCKAYT